MSRKELLFLIVLGVLFAAVAVSYGVVIRGAGKTQVYEGGVTYDQVRVVVETLPESLSLSAGNTSAHHVLLNTHEGLVRIDSFFRIVPGLAYSWGNTDKEGLWWEFQLRPDVRFHSGATMTTDHVRQMFMYYQQQAQSSEYLGQLLASVDRFEYEGHRVRIKTKYPDPLLLYRLSFLFIASTPEATSLDGTGPYRLEQYSASEALLERFDRYWGRLPAVRRAYLAVVEHPVVRQQEFLSGITDILMAVPAERAFIDRLEQEPTIRLYRIPSLEVIYVMFNVREMLGRAHNPLADELLREAISVGIDRVALARIPLLTTLAKQFVASGVFGYDTSLDSLPYVPERTKEILGERYLTVRLALPQSFQILGEAIRNHLDPLHIRVELDVYGDDRIEEFLTGIREQRFQMYMIGTKYDVADSVDFFRTVAHSQEGNYGRLNGSGFSSIELDDQIQRAERMLDQEERLSVLHSIQRTFLEQRLGLPLFELDKVYGVQNRLQWQPRMDGYMVLSDIQ